MSKRTGVRTATWTRMLLLPLCAGALCVSAPAQAQFSKGYKFLEAVKKKDGVTAEEAINKPGSTVINARDVTTGETALHLVAQRRDLTWLRYLVAKGANVNIRDDKGITPLQIAANLGWLDGVEFLVANNADLDESNDTGETPLITAVLRKDAGIMRALLKAGADPDRADNSGRSARDYAKLSKNSSQLLELIDQYADAKTKAARQATYGPTL